MFFRKKQIGDLSDEELIARYQRSDDAAYVGELFERYNHMVFLVGMKYLKDPTESEDMAMLLFEKLLADLHKYQIKHFKSWLHTVVRNQCFAILEQQQRRRQQTDAYQESLEGDVEKEVGWPLIPEGGEREQTLQQLEAALRLLNDHQRVCLEQFYLQQKSYQEVADQTGFTLKQVKSYIQNGKRNLRKHLETPSSDSPLPFRE
jgi:RNA polymerase sigma-70 factor (ECF subfamily)